MNKPNFGALLDKPASEIERPKPMPAGSYLCIVKGLPRQDKSSKKQTEFVEFTLQPTAVGADVDQEELAEIGGFADKTIKATHYITEASLWRLKEFLEHLAVEGDTLREQIDNSPNCQVVAFLRHEASNDGQSVFATFAKSAPADSFEAA